MTFTEKHTLLLQKINAEFASGMFDMLTKLDNITEKVKQINKSIDKNG